MAVTLTTSQSTILRAGKNVSEDLINGETTDGTDANTAVEQFINDAECYIITATLHDWVTDYSKLNASVKRVLNYACSSQAAMDCVNYEMGDYNQLTEAQTMLDLLEKNVIKAISILTKIQNTDFMKEESNL